MTPAVSRYQGVTFAWRPSEHVVVHLNKGDGGLRPPPFFRWATKSSPISPQKLNGQTFQKRGRRKDQTRGEIVGQDCQEASRESKALQS